MRGVLLDSHTPYWLVNGDQILSDDALLAIGQGQQTGTLFVSPVTAWELAVANLKTRVAGRPDLGTKSPDRWFRDAVRATSAKIIPIQQRISCETARVVSDTGHKDPGDCFLVATARVRGVSIVTRDRFMRSIAADDPEYLDVIVC